MVTKHMAEIRSSSEVRQSSDRCSICRKKMRASQEILTIDNKQFCDACYHDSFFANAMSNNRLTLDPYDG